MRFPTYTVFTAFVLAILPLILCIVVRTSKYYPALRGISIDTYSYPKKDAFHTNFTTNLVSSVSINRLKNRLEVLAHDFPDGRYYKSPNGLKASNYLYSALNKFAQRSHNNFTVEKFNHAGWSQPSLIFRIKGANDKLVIVGCHIDSMNLIPWKKSPGVDDNLSGIDVILEALDIYTEQGFIPTNTLEFHFYAAEEAGCLGSRELIRQYRGQHKEVIGMLQQDMTGYTEKSETEHLGLITDYGSRSLTSFLADLIDQYLDIPYKKTKCGRICSDQISFLLMGYPASYVLESELELSNPYIHSESDTLQHINFQHLVQHTKLVCAFLAELGFTTLPLAKPKNVVSFGYYDLLILASTGELSRLFVWMIILSIWISNVGLLISDLWNRIRSKPVDIEEVTLLEGDHHPLNGKKGQKIM